MNGIDTTWAAWAADPAPGVRAVAWALVHFLWQGALAGLFATAALHALRRARASLRYAVAVALFALLAALPAATAFHLFEGDRAGTAPSTPAGSPESARPVASSDAPAPASVAGRAPLRRSLAPLLPAVFGLWLLGVSALGLAHLGGWWRLRRLVDRARPLGGGLEERARALARGLGIARAVRFLASASVPVPAVIGWLRPAVLVPASTVAGLTPWQLEAILAHELAHVRRHDYLVNLLQAAVETLFFYHPAVWWLSNEIRRERENCCDDLAVELCGDRLGYARALADLEGLRSAPSRLALAADGGSLLDRVRRLAGVPGSPARRPRRSGLVGALILALVPAFVGLRSSPGEAAPPTPGGGVALSAPGAGRGTAGAPILGAPLRPSAPPRDLARSGVGSRIARPAGVVRPAGIDSASSRAAARGASSRPAEPEPAGRAKGEAQRAVSAWRPLLLAEKWKDQGESALALSRFPKDDLTRILVLEKSPDFLGALTKAAAGDPGC